MTHLYELRCDPDDSAGLRDEIRRRDKIIESLMHQVEHSLNAQDTDYALMQSTFLLEEQVRDRTGKLDATMRELHKLNLKLAQQQAAAEAARSRLQLAVGSSTDGFALFDAADRLDLANRRFSEVLSLHASPVSIPENAPFEQVLTALRAAGHDPAWTIQWRDLHARARQGEKVVAEVCLGEDLWIRITENLASDNSIVGTYADISEMKQREHRRHETDLELERAHLIHAVGNISQGISMIDGDLKLVVCNPRFLELLDFPPALGVPGTPFAAFLRYNAERGEYGPGDADEQVRTRMQQVLRFEPHVFERERPDGTIIEIVGKPLPEGGFITTYTDITERKRNELALREFNATLERRIAERTEALQNALTELGAVIENLQQTQEGLIQSEKLASLGAMVAGIAHELNTPIGNSLMVATHFVDASNQLIAALQTGIKRSTLDHYLNDAVTAGDVLVRNLNKAAELVASFKQVAVDRTSSQRRRFGLAEMIAEVVTILGPTIRKTRYVIEQDIPGDIVMESYPGPLGQVLTNLINNAIIHGFEGRTSGCIRIAAATTAGADQIVLTVSDDGNGIAADVLPRIYDPFFTTKLGQGGSGLGLNMVHTMVFGILGGRISVESKRGRGSCFTLVLAARAPEPEHPHGTM